MAAYLRYFERRHEAWFQRPPELERICETLTNRKTPADFSVFRCETPQQEAVVAAAWRLSKGQSFISRCCAARITDDDLRKAGLAAQTDPGRFGVEAADRLHANVVAQDGSAPTVQGLDALLAEVVDQHTRGDDRIRFFGKNQVAWQLEQFLAGEAGQLSPLAENRCQQALAAQPP